jgi:predicted oxidoreductase
VPLGRFLQSGYLKRGSTIRELAAAIGVDPDQLDRTVQAYNRPAAQGQDPAFGKGVSDYDRGNGDATATLSRNVRPLDRGPYYAIALQPGDLGTFIGLRTDAGARVLDRSGAPVPGLFAAGNAAATMTGGNYPAAGLTIGAALTFGYIAAQSVAD